MGKSLAVRESNDFWGTEWNVTESNSVNTKGIMH